MRREYSLNSTSPVLQNKTITITANGITTITPDSGYDGLGSVVITTNVASDDVYKWESRAVLRTQDGTYYTNVTLTRCAVGIVVPSGTNYVTVKVGSGFSCGGFIQISKVVTKIENYAHSLILTSDTNWAWHDGSTSYTSQKIVSGCKMVVINFSSSGSHSDYFARYDLDNFFTNVLQEVSFT